AVLHPCLEQTGGAEAVAYYLCLGLDRLGHAVTLYTDRVGGKWGRDIEYHSLHLHAAADHPGAWRRAGEYFARELAGYDAVLCHNYPTHCWYAAAQEVNPAMPPALGWLQEPPRHLYYEQLHEALPAAFYTRAPLWRRLGIPNIADFFQKRDPAAREKLRARDRAALATLRGVLVSSDYIGGWVTRLYGLPAAKVILGTRVEVRDHLPAERQRYVLCVTRLELLKNVETLLRAFAVTARQVPGISLVVVGEGDDARRLRWLRDQLGLERKVLFRGMVSNEELLWLYRRAQLFAFVPLVEPFGLVNLEAMACGVPVVTSSAGGPAETVGPAVGVTVDPLDADALAAAMTALLNDPARLAALGAAGQAQARAWQFTQTVADVAARLATLVG
ncbi:MAG TPA: glycosyltransferase, partial [bacterium]|nr:glycosyltransferase [bacterium]